MAHLSTLNAVHVCCMSSTAVEAMFAWRSTDRLVGQVDCCLEEVGGRSGGHVITSTN